MENYIYYEDNPNLDQLVVDTHDGKKEYRVNCRKIRHAFYVKDKTCFLINGQWYRIDSGLIIYDHHNKNWILSKNHNMINGIVSFTKDGERVMGNFTPSPVDNVVFVDHHNGNQYIMLNAEIAEGVAHENYSDGVFYRIANLSKAKASQIQNIVNHKNKGYNIEDNVDEMHFKIDTYNKYNPQIPANVSRYAKYLGDISFGVEIETIAGYLPDYIQCRTGTIICRDGSLHAKDGTQGPEYTTIPMTGAKGIQSIITLCKELTKRNTVDHQCSLHFHIGNIPSSRLFMTTLYKLGLMIQDDLFKMFPMYKTDEPRYANKDKNYCAKLKPLSRFPLKDFSKSKYDNYIYDNYLRIFNFLSNDVAPNKKYNRRIGQHPKAEKWNRTARYHWLNLINLVFSKRNTVEFRIHQGTTNAQKVISWLFICNAIIKTAILESSKILRGEEITIHDVLNYYAKFYKNTTGNAISMYLTDYYNSRVTDFYNLTEAGDYLGVKEVREDKEFFFEHSSFATMFK